MTAMHPIVQNWWILLILVLALFVGLVLWHGRDRGVDE